MNILINWHLTLDFLLYKDRQSDLQRYHDRVVLYNVVSPQPTDILLFILIGSLFPKLTSSNVLRSIILL